MLALAAALAAPPALDDRSQMARILAAEVRLARRPALAVLLAPGDWTEAAHQQILLDAAREGLRRRALALSAQMIASEKLARRGGEDPPAATIPANGLAAVTAADAPYRLPVSGRLLARFGTLDAQGIRARGISLLPRSGETLIVPSAGRVAYSGRYRGFGEVLIVEHGHGWTSLVAGGGLSGFETGAWLAQGQAIGTAAGPLLVELRHDGRPVDVLAVARRLGGSAISQQGLSR